MKPSTTKRTTPTPPEARPGFLVYRAGLAVARGYERALAPIDVSPPEAGVLSMLAYVGPNHVRGLARSLGLGRQSIVNVTKRLEECQFIARSKSRDDGRLTILSITPKGKRKLVAVERIVRQFDRRLQEVVGPAHERILCELLLKMVQAPFLAHDE